jgi:hypothetical protein
LGSALISKSVFIISIGMLGLELHWFQSIVEPSSAGAITLKIFFYKRQYLFSVYRSGIRGHVRTIDNSACFFETAPAASMEATA